MISILKKQSTTFKRCVIWLSATIPALYSASLGAALLCCLCRQYNIGDRQVKIPLNISASGDITVVLYHARSTFGGKIQGKVLLQVFVP